MKNSWFKRAPWPVITSILFFLGTAAHAQAGADAHFSSLQRRMSEVFRENSSGVVRIKAAGKEGVAPEGASLRVGTGFIISRSGHILTNSSIAYGAERLWAEHQDIPYLLEEVGHDPSTNVSLLKFITPPPEFTIIPLDNGGSTPAITSFVLGVTMPLEFDPSPSWGIITGRESYFGNRFFPAVYLRTTIPAAPGAGGSPVFDLQGQFVGMVVASVPDIYSSYVLPARALIRVRDELLFSGRVSHAFLGIEINEETGVEFGRRVTVTDVLEEGPAALAGIKAGDILIEFAERRIERFHDFVDAVFFVRPGQEVSVVLWRGGEKITTSMKVQSREALASEEQEPTPAVSESSPESGSPDTSQE